MGPDLIVVSTPILHFLPCIVKAQEPMRVQTLRAEAAEGFDVSVIGRLAGPAEVERNAVDVGR